MNRSTIRTFFAHALPLAALAATQFACSDSTPQDEEDEGALKGNVASDQNRPSFLAVDATSLYWTTFGTEGGHGAVFKGSKSGGQPTKLTDTSDDASALAVDETNVYWVERTGDLFALAKSGGSPKKLGSTEKDRTPNVVIDADAVYVANSVTLVRFPKAGGASVKLATAWISSLAHDTTTLYYGKMVNGLEWGVFSLPKTGKFPEDEKRVGGKLAHEPFGFSADAKYIYFTVSEDVGAGQRVVRLDKASGESTELAGTERTALLGTVNDKALCFASRDAISCQALGGRSAVRVAKGHSIQAVVLDGNHIVYTEEGTTKGFFDNTRGVANSGAVQRVELPSL